MPYYGMGDVPVCLRTSTTACRRSFGKARRQPNFVWAERSEATKILLLQNL